jgi:hypothetical protein
MALTIKNRSANSVETISINMSVPKRVRNNTRKGDKNKEISPIIAVIKKRGYRKILFQNFNIVLYANFLIYKFINNFNTTQCFCHSADHQTPEFVL